MTRWLRAAVDLRHALTKRCLGLSTSTSLYSTSSQFKNPRKPRTTTKPAPPAQKQFPKSSEILKPPSAQMNKMMLFKKHDDVAELDEPRWPKPTEIPWQARVANCINLIGHIKTPVQLWSDGDGKKSWAASVIRQETSPNSNPLSMPVLFEGDLAHVAACHVKENDYVYVAGHLSAEPFPFNPSNTAQSLKVIAESINFVDEKSRIKKYVSNTKSKDGSKQKDVPFKDDGAVFDENNTSVIQSWRNLLLKPQEWWDIRPGKENSTGAAFKCKDTGELLYIDEFTPQWLLRKLECLTLDHQIQNTETKQQTASGNTHDASLGPWKDLLDEPQLWRDYRKDKQDGKVSSKHPDFKRKEGSVSLWLNTAPRYILSELDNLDFGMMDPQPPPQQAKRNKGEESWKDLVENPHLWSDNRLKKRSEKAPDFKRKDTDEALWLNSAPKSILNALENVDFGAPTSVRAKIVKGEESWKDLVENPHLWSDNRSKKQSEKAPDFTHKDTGEALWLNSAPKTILDALENVDFGASTSVRAKIVKGEESWNDVVENPRKWWDNRSKKLNYKSPDFKHKETGECLWIRKAPGWVLSKLPPSKAMPSSGSKTKEPMMS